MVPTRQRWEGNVDQQKTIDHRDLFFNSLRCIFVECLTNVNPEICYVEIMQVVCSVN